MLCEADDLNYGAMWECPLLIELNSVPTKVGRQSQAAVDQLSNSFHNQAAFFETSNGDSAKSNQTIAANDPRDSTQVPSLYYAMLSDSLPFPGPPHLFQFHIMNLLCHAPECLGFSLLIFEAA